MVQRYLSFANLLLITAIIYLGVNTFYTFTAVRLDPGTVTTKTGDLAPSMEQESTAPLPQYNTIAERNLFNITAEPDSQKAEPEAEAVNLDALKETDLKLKLWGTVTGGGEQSYAVIEDQKAREQNLYRAGDTIQDATVKLILREKVVLTVEGRDEILAMEETASENGGMRAGNSAAGTAQTPRLPVSPYTRKVRLPSAQVHDALQNLGSIMDQATIRPHIEDGQPDGISITAIKPNTIFRQMRLRNGDVITGVNGNPVRSMEDAMRIFGDITNSDSVQVEIKRRGRSQILDYQIE
jgi:general secretion pathway protein C